jgi:hypothetical protein
MTQNKIPDMRLAVDGKYDGSYVIAAVDVAPEGITFIRSELLKHGPMSRKVAKLFGNGGVAFALMQEGVTSDSKFVKNFDYDSYDPMIQIGDEVAHKWLAEYAMRRWGSASQVILEEPIAKFNEERGPLQDESFGSEGFFYLTPHSGDLFKDLEDASGRTGFFRYGFVISPRVPLSANGQMDTQTIEALAQNTRMAFISAYDSMSYVVWMK